MKSKKIQKVRILSSVVSQNTLVTFFRFKSSVFHYVLKAASNNSNLSCDIVLLSQFLMQPIGITDRSLTAFFASIIRHNFNKTIIFLSRNLSMKQRCFSYNLLLQKSFFIIIYKLSFPNQEMS